MESQETNRLSISFERFVLILRWLPNCSLYFEYAQIYFELKQASCSNPKPRYLILVYWLQFSSIWSCRAWQKKTVTAATWKKSLTLTFCYSWVKPVCMSLLVSEFCGSLCVPTFSNCVAPLSSKLPFLKLYFVLKIKISGWGTNFGKLPQRIKTFYVVSRLFSQANRPRKLGGPIGGGIRNNLTGY